MKCNTHFPLGAIKPKMKVESFCNWFFQCVSTASGRGKKKNVSYWLNYCCARCQAKSRFWTLVCCCDNQCIVSIADLEVQLLYSSNPPLNAHTESKFMLIFFCSCFAHHSIIISIIIYYRDAVDVKGLDKVATSDGISQGSIQTFIWVNGCYRGDGGTHCFWSFTQHSDVLLLRKFWSVVVLIHNVNIDGG